MPDNSSLIRQLAHRCQSFHRVTGISQSQMATAINMPTGNYSSFLAGKRGIGPEAVCALLKFTALPREQAIALFSKPVLSSQILNLQERGQALRFDNSGWIAQEGNDAADPINSGGDITNVPKAATQQVADLVEVFKHLDHLTRKGVIDSFIKAHATANSIPTSQRFNRKGS